MRTRQIEFDIARGIGVAAVVFAHNGGVLPGYSYITPYYIALFFVISGYFYKENSNNRALKLGNIYLKYTLFLFLVSLLTQSEHWVHNLLGALYGRYCFFPYYEEPNVILLTMSNHPLWFLLGLLLATLALGILLPKLDTGRKRVIVLIMLLIISWGLTYLPILLPWSMDTVSVFVMFMLVGYWMNYYSIFPLFYQTRYKYIIFAVLGIFYWILKKADRNINLAVREYGMSIGGGQNKLENVIMCFLIGVIGSFLCIVVCNVIKNFFIGKLFAVVGRHTIPILGLHVFLYDIVSNVFPMYDGINNLQYKAMICLVNVLIIIVCILIDIFLVNNFGKICSSCIRIITK